MIDYGYVITGALTGFLVGLTGVGGGALTTPILLLFFGVSPTTAIATDLWFSAITKVAGASIHHANQNVDWQIVRRLWWGSLPTSLLIVVLVVTGTKFAKLWLLTQAIGMVVLITAIGLFIAPKLVAIAKSRRIEQPAKFKALQPMLTVVSGAILGLCVALTSIGAGALGSVMLLYLYPLRMSPHRLVATDIVHAIPVAALAGIGYLFAGMVNWPMLLSLLVGSLPAVILGSTVTKRFSARWIQILLSVVLLATAWKILN